MTTASEFCEYARECLEWADAAETEEQRESFLDMAKHWTLAAFRTRRRVLSGSRRATICRDARAVRSPQRAISIVEIAAVAVALVGFGVALYLLRGTFL